MNIKLNSRWVYGALIVALSLWILYNFREALLAASVTAIASWPLYTRFRARLPERASRNASALAFTLLMTVFVLGPLLFAVGAMLTEAHALLADLAAIDRKGIGVPGWLESLPLAGRWASARWQRELAHPGALSMWVQRADSTAWLDWAHVAGQFLARHVFIIVFAILVLFFLYQEGASLARDFRRMLRDVLGERAEQYIEVATRSVRASVNSVLVVSLFDGFGALLAYLITGVPHAAVWASITGAFALVPFLGYVAVAALALKLGLTEPATPTILACVLGCAVLFFGDKVVRPLVAREGTHLPFVWVLIGCLGGFEALGLVGLVVGPVVLTLVRELWDQRVRDLASSELTESRVPVERRA
jgi:predicted PurR-regulated permease PerM